MKRRDLVDLLLLAMLWGGSFIFMRIAVPEFGPFAMVEMRVAIAALLLLAIMARQGGIADLRANWLPLSVVGATNSAIPFTLIGYGMLSITAGFGGILNATSPLFAAIIAYVWLRERLAVPRVAGLFVGFAGVALLVWGRPAMSLGGDGVAIAVVLLGALSYGVAPNFTKRNLGGVAPLTIATGSQIAAALLLLPLAVLYWPQQVPSPLAWAAAIVLGVASTGLAYILYFRLIRNVGPTRAIAVTFLVPMFGMLWGMLFLGEAVTAAMIAGCAVILLGTALATGLLGTRAEPVPASPR